MGKLRAEKRGEGGESPPVSEGEAGQKKKAFVKGGNIYLTRGPDQEGRGSAIRIILGREKKRGG